MKVETRGGVESERRRKEAKRNENDFRGRLRVVLKAIESGVVDEVKGLKKSRRNIFPGRDPRGDPIERKKRKRKSFAFGGTERLVGVGG